MMRFFRRRAGVVDVDKQQARATQELNALRIERLRNEASVITIHMPKVKRQPAK